MFGNIHRPVLASLFLARVFAAPTQVLAEEEVDKKALKERSCIHVSSINGFNPIDNKHLTVSVGANKTYLVTLFNRCHELKWTEQIGIHATMSWSCSNSKDHIIVDGRRCLVSDIEQVEDRDAAKVLVSELNEGKS
jgi:hypothetical protein